MTVSHWLPLSSVTLKAVCSGGIKRIQAISAADTAKDRISHGFAPSARTQTGSVLER